MFNWLKSRLADLGKRRITGISLIANWLEGALWNIEAKFIPLVQQAYGTNEIVFACLRLLSQSVPEAPLVAYRMDEEHGTKTPLPYSHPLVRLIKRPNELMTEYEFWELTTIHMAAVGRSCWWKQRNNKGDTIALWPLRPDRVGPIYSNEDTDGRRVLWGWSYQNPSNSEWLPLPRADVMSFNFPDPTGESGGVVEGYGPIQALARQISSDNEATKFVGALLANYAAPTVALIVKTPIRNEEDANLVKSKFRHEFGGSNRGGVALLDADSDIKTIGFNLQELEFPDLRMTAESRIAAALGVPAILVGLKIGLKEGNNRASVTEQRAYFAETTLSNYWRRYQDQYSEDIAQDFGADIVCEFDTLKVKAMATHFQAKLKPIKDAWGAGAVTRNEYRNALGLPLLEPDRGDIFLVPQNMQEVPVDPADEVVPVQPQTSEVPALPVPPQEGAQEKPETGGENVGQPIGTVEPTNKAIKATDEFQDKAERLLIGILAALFANYEEAVRDALTGKKEFDYAAFALELQAALEPQLATFAIDQALRDATSLTIGVDTADISVLASEWAREYVASLVAGITETTRKAIEAAMSRTDGQPLSEAQLALLIGAILGETRAEMIAISETTKARTEGTLIYQQLLILANVSMQLTFHTARDERVCPQCGPLDGAKEGSSLFSYPPLHPRCRCWVELESKG